MIQPERNLLAIPIWGVFLLGLVALFYFAQAILIPIALALLFTLILSPVVRLLQRWKIPRPIGSLFVLCLVFGSLTLLTNSLADPVSDWIERFPDDVKTLKAKFNPIKHSLREVRETTETFEEIASINNLPDDSTVVVRGPGLDSILIDNTQSFLIGLASFIVLLYFLLSFGDSLMRNITELGNSSSLNKMIKQASYNIQTNVSRYLFIITLINVCLGLATSLAMYLLGMPTPALWGTTTAILNYIPYVGPALSVGIITFVSVLSFDALNKMWQAPLAALILTLVEGQILQPIFVGTLFRLNPVVVFLSVLAWGWLWGVAGVLIAIPVLMTLKITLDQHEYTRNIGQLIAR